MRVKNKEIRRRRHRKEQVVKAAAREVRLKYADKDLTPKPKPAVAAKKPAKSKKTA